MPKRLICAAIIASLSAIFLATVAAAQWPTTCVELNDIVEAHLGNQGNVGIYQRAFGDGAEQACQNDHRDDVRSAFAWVNDPGAAINTPAVEFSYNNWRYVRADDWMLRGSNREAIPTWEAGVLTLPEPDFSYDLTFPYDLDDFHQFVWDYDYEYRFSGSRDAFTSFVTYELSGRFGPGFPVQYLGCEQEANGWRLWAVLSSGFDYVYNTSTITFSYHVDNGPVQTEYWLIDEFEINPVAWTYSPDNLIRQTIGASRIVSRFQVGQDISRPRVVEPYFPAPELNFVLEKCGRTYRAPVSQGWPETCVELNDIVETHLGNTGNVGIYQSVFGNQAESGCQGDHRNDVRSVFAWAIS